MCDNTSQSIGSQSIDSQPIEKNEKIGKNLSKMAKICQKIDKFEKIQNILSFSSKRSVASPYMMSKWALAGLTLGMAKVCIKDGIVVNAVAPGLTATKIQLENPRENIANSRLPMERYIMPEEIANIAVMLVSDLGRSVIGDTVYATGEAGVITYDDIDY